MLYVSNTAGKYNINWPDLIFNDVSEPDVKACNMELENLGSLEKTEKSRSLIRQQIAAIIQ